MGAFEAFLPNLAPKHLQGPRAQAFFAGIGAAMDGHVLRTKQGVLARFAASAPTDALGLIGQDRRIVRGPNETDASYRARLIAAFPAWRWSGTAQGLLQYGLAPAGYATAAVIRNRDWVNVAVSRFGGSGTGTVTATSCATATAAPFHHTVSLVFGVTSVSDPTLGVSVSVDGGTQTVVSPLPQNLWLDASGNVLPSAACAQYSIALGNIGGFMNGDGFYITCTPNPPDTNNAQWARFWVVLAGTGFTAIPRFGAPPLGTGDTFGDGCTFGSSATGAEVAFVRQVIELWRPARSQCVGVFVVLPVTPSGAPCSNSSTRVDSFPASGNWLEETRTFGGAACAFWRFSSSVLAPP